MKKITQINKVLKQFSFLLFILTAGFIIAQNKQDNSYKSKVNNPNANYYDIVAQKRAEFNLLDLNIKANNKAYKQFERWAYIWKDRINADGSFPTAINNNISKNDYIDLLLNNQSLSNRNSSSSVWTQVGPVGNPNINGYTAFPGKGRINVVVEDPNNTQILYAGSAAGGIWKTVDGGSTWAPKSDNLAGLGVSDILIDPTNSSIIYMATGDADASHISSIGLYKSIDAGNTWTATGLTFSLTDNNYIRDIAFAPGNSSKIFALTNSEVMVSTDSGVTWSNAPIDTGAFTFTERFQSIIFDPNDATKIVISDYYNGFYVSTNSGNSFTIHPQFQGGNSRETLKLTTTPNDPDHFYALSHKSGDDGLFRKYRFAFDNTAADLISTTTVSGFNSQGGYNICLAVSPTDKNNIIIAGVRGYKSTDGGVNFTVTLNPYNDPPGIGFYVHPDHHHLSFLTDGDTVLNGHDGGVHKGLLSSTNWADLSPGLNISQPYNIAITQSTNGDDFMMANQDNDGFSKVLKDDIRQWVSCLAGDGTSTGIDYNTPSTRYLGGTRGTLYRSDDGYASSYASATEILSGVSAAAFVSPMAVHPTTPTTVYAADSDVKKSTDRGDNFTALNSGLTGIDFLDVTTNGTSTRIYVIGGDDTAKRSDDDGANWITITPPTGQVINSFSAMPNTTIVYATVKGYSAGNKVYKSTDNGATWTNMSTGIPNIIMKKIIVKTNLTNETLFLGTELGVYSKNNLTSTWAIFGTGLPNVLISDFKINYTDEQLYIGTFGRGMWKASVNSAALDVEESIFNISEMPIVYPNPIINSIVNIKISNTLLINNKKLIYIIYNTVGGIIKEGVLTDVENKILVGNLANGIYMVRVSNNEYAVVKKLVVKQ